MSHVRPFYLDPPVQCDGSGMGQWLLTAQPLDSKPVLVYSSLNSTFNIGFNICKIQQPLITIVANQQISVTGNFILVFWAKEISRFYRSKQDGKNSASFGCIDVYCVLDHTDPADVCRGSERVKH